MPSIDDIAAEYVERAAANIAKRMAAVPQAYRQLSATLPGAARDGRWDVKAADHDSRSAGAAGGSILPGRLDVSG